ncbi:hypothetical protein RDWZM_001032 [Blomia tropicalis]|uniref:glutathione transferase n=1 Tax=Blomia tropicalis TaxID=40697 RepID=A0A9Q0MBH7_BLOTA|nr:hypothetical protein RDWZM_001032 [Blomia tropicalis]WBV73470.1 allergen [Blomia tropicalis]
MAPLKIGYWDIRGFAEPIRMLLKHLNIEFEETRYGFGNDSEESFPNRDEWLAEKFTLGLEFPNLPYLFDGDFKMTESVAILKRLARANGMIATTEPALSYSEMIEAMVIDIRNRLVYVIYAENSGTPEEFEQKLADLRERLETSLGQLEAFFQKHGSQWVAGDKLTYVDFLAYEYLDWYRVFVKSTPIFEKFAKVSDYMKRFEELPSLKEYIASDEHRSASCLSPFARIGHRWAKE